MKFMLEEKWMSVSSSDKSAGYFAPALPVWPWVKMLYLCGSVHLYEVKSLVV